MTFPAFLESRDASFPGGEVALLQLSLILDMTHNVCFVAIVCATYVKKPSETLYL